MPRFTPASRQRTLDILLGAFSKDPRLSGLLIVGSGADGFADRFSDIDLSVVLPERAQAQAVYEDWRRRLEGLLPVAHAFGLNRGPDVYLYGALLEDFLELDISFLALPDLYAKRPRWKVAFDRSGQIEARMQASWAECCRVDVEGLYRQRLDSIWHAITHVPALVERGQYWRALYYLQELRDKTVDLAGLRWGVETEHFRQVDALPPGFLEALATTLAAPEPEAIMEALRAAVSLFFEQARALDEQLGLEASGELEARMQTVTLKH